MSGSIDLGNFTWDAYDLVVIDESHNFRNDEGKRYQRLFEDIIKSGAPTAVLMLSATPVNTSLIDLRNQIHLMSGGKDDHFRQEVGIGSVRSVMGVSQREFKQWEESRARSGAAQNKSALLEKLGPDFQRLLDAATIARSRKQIKNFYEADLAKIGQFPATPPPSTSTRRRTCSRNSRTRACLRRSAHSLSPSTCRLSTSLIQSVRRS